MGQDGGAFSLALSRVMSEFIPPFTALVIDAEESAGRLLAARIADMGGRAQWLANRQDAFRKFSESHSVDMIFFDPAPYRDVRMVSVELRKHCPTFTYLVALRGDAAASPLDPLAQTGANLVIAKPVGAAVLAEAIEDATTLMTMLRILNDPAYDTKSGGGVIAKSAFAQLFLSALDRADRYGEQTFVLEISLDNLVQIRAVDGLDTAVTIEANLAHVLTRLRRQSDILGAVEAGAFMLMLQRPAYVAEPVDAALRFADQLVDPALWAAVDVSVPIHIHVRLTELPTGHVHVVHDVVVAR